MKCGKMSYCIIPLDPVDCRCQFHDVLPGSSIEMVYEDASAVYPVVPELTTDLHKSVQDGTTFTQRRIGCLGH
jgi:hypothetical protein